MSRGKKCPLNVCCSEFGYVDPVVSDNPRLGSLTFADFAELRPIFIAKIARVVATSPKSRAVR